MKLISEIVRVNKYLLKNITEIVEDINFLMTPPSFVVFCVYVLMNIKNVFFFLLHSIVS